MATKKATVPRAEMRAYLDRARTPAKKLVTTSALLNAVKRFLPTIEAIAEEAIERQRALQEAEIAEPDASRRGQLEEAFQKLGALRRIAGDLALNTRQIVQAARELDEADARIAAQSEPAPVAAKARAAAKQPRAAKPKVVKSKPEK